MGRVKFYADEDIDMALIHYLRSKHKILRSPYFALQSDLHFWYNAEV